MNTCEQHSTVLYYYTQYGVHFANYRLWFLYVGWENACEKRHGSDIYQGRGKGVYYTTVTVVPHNEINMEKIYYALWILQYFAKHFVLNQYNVKVKEVPSYVMVYKNKEDLYNNSKVVHIAKENYNMNTMEEEETHIDGGSNSGAVPATFHFKYYNNHYK